MMEQENEINEDFIQGEYVVSDDDFNDLPPKESSSSETSEETVETQSEDTQVEETEETDTEQKPPEKSAEQIEIERLSAQLREETRAKNKAWAEARQIQKQQKELGALTDDQLIAIMEQHKDDPAAQYKVFKYMAQEEAKRGQENAVDAVKLAQTKAQTDSYVSQRYSDLLDESKPAYSYAQNLKRELNLENHPHAEFLIGNTMVAVNYEKALQEQYQKGFSEGQGKSVESNRKKSIKEGKLEKGNTKGKSKPIASPEHQSVIKILGLKGKAAEDYLKMMNNGGV